MVGLIKRRSIAFQLIMLVSVALILVATIRVLLLNNFVNKTIGGRIITENTLKVESTSKDINIIFNNAKILTEQMANNQEIKKYINTYRNRKDVYSNSLRSDVIKTLEGIKKTSSIYSIAWVASLKAGFYIDNTGFIPDSNYIIEKRPWYPLAIATRGVVFSSPYIDYTSKEVVFTSVMAVKEGGKIIGFVALDCRVNSLPEILKPIKVGQKGKGFLITSIGELVYRDDKKISAIESIFNSEIELKQTAKKILATKEKFDEINYKGENYYVVAYPVKVPGWVVILLINKAEAMKDLTQFNFTINLITIFIFSALMLMITIIINKSTRPIGVITRYAEEIAAGEFDKNLPEEFLSKPNEIGDLSKAFQVITGAFRKENIILEERIQDKNKELELQYSYILETEKIASLGSLVAGVAHEINTPLGIGITTVSYLEKINNENRRKLAEGTMNKSDLKEFMEEINDSIDMLNINLGRAGELIKSFKKIAVDQSNESKVSFSLKENIDDVIMSLKHEFRNFSHQIFNECPKEIVINSFPGAFSQIFTNLIMNSLLHGFKDKEEGNIYIAVSELNNIIKIVYTDDGGGIKEENLNRIFEPFYTTNRHGGGSGLGLHIVHNIVFQQLKGNIHCESGLGAGVKFIIEFPEKGF
jgi:signal transduction histidine kinase